MFYINPVVTELMKDPCLGSSEQCYVVLYALTRALQAKKILEIGTHRGVSSIVMAQAVRDNGVEPEIWTIDDYTQGLDPAKYKTVAQEAFVSSGFQFNIFPLIGTSSEILRNWSGFGIDFAFIDGGHLTEEIEVDFKYCACFTDTFIFHDTVGMSQPRAFVESLKARGYSVTTFPTAVPDGRKVGISLVQKA